MRLSVLFIVVLLCPLADAAPLTHGDLLRFFSEWREFQQPKVKKNVPDYTAPAMRRQQGELKHWQERLEAFDISSWTVTQKVDYNLVRAEMNGLDFDHRVLRPWSRNPLFYRIIFDRESDTPLPEGPSMYGTLELWSLKMPLSPMDEAYVLGKLQAIPAILKQAKSNLTEDAKDLYTIAIHAKKQESYVLATVGRRFGETNFKLVPAILQAQAAVDDFIKWMEGRVKTMKTGSGVGVVNYNWYLKNVHLNPYTWQQLLQIMELELERSLAAWKLEEHRNRNLPVLALPATAQEYDRRNTEAIDGFMKFLRENEIFTVPAYMNLDRLRGKTTLLPKAALDIFTNVDYRDSMPMKSHMIHWLEKQRLEIEPHYSPIRTRLLYNIWDGRSEGLATAWEEATMDLGILDQRPRARELVHILAVVRAIRGIADLKFHSGEFTLEQAMKYIVDHTPNGWFQPNGDTIWTDMSIYATQPSYGTTYIAGKVAFNKLIADSARQNPQSFQFKDFMDRFFASGIIPMSMIRWEMTGIEDELKQLEARH
ncbi:DUF885 family protein [Bryobacter aggregatus]|uniref:DUF885 family protein n=1 Tax=Bryobacter aggregatus TaxID=360054 RepID=UPI0004E0D47D|nr:DUF885 family protein [Bryobacter aggregatus]